MNVFDMAAGRAWALADEDLLAVMTIAARAGEGPEAVALRLGRPLDNTRTASVRDGVAVVPLDGPMFRRANMLTEISGATSTEQFAQDFQAALDNPAVASIVLDISSPGGEAAGVNEVANAIHAARGAKPIVAYVGDRAASGAYWVASAADQIVLDATAGVGSIGVVSRYVKQADRQGVTMTEIVSTQSPKKRLDPQTEPGRAVVQREVDSIAQVFVDAVARNRGVSASAVLEDFGQGGMEIGAEAVRRGMADSIGSLDQVIAGLSRTTPAGNPGPTARRPLMADTTKPSLTAGPETAVSFAASHPEIAEALRAEGREVATQGHAAALATARTESTAAERVRIRGIEAAALPGYRTLADAAIEDGSSPETFALRQATAQKQAGSAHLDALRADEAAASKLAPDTVGNDKPAPVDPNLPLADRIKAEWNSTPAVRAEFGEQFSHYAAYREADEAGRIRRIAKGA